MKTNFILLLFLIVSKNLFSADVKLVSLNINGYAELNSTIYCVVENDSYSVASFNVNFSIDGGTVTSETIYTANISAPQRWWFPLSNPAIFSSTGSHTLKVWTSLPDGAPDTDLSDDSINQMLTILQYAPQKNVMIDRIVGEWSGYCPDADVRSRQIADTFSNRIIQVAYHNNDYLTTPEDAFLEYFYEGLNGYPYGMIDRFEFSWWPGEFQDRFWWTTQIDERLKYIVPAEVILSGYSFDSVTNNFSVSVTANFYAGADDTFQLDLVITEDSIISQTQSNYYNVPGAANPDQPELNNIGDPIVNYAHMDVERDVLGAPSSTIPSSIPSSGGSYSYTFTGTLDAAWNEQHLNFIGMLYFNTGFPDHSEVMNCSSLKTECSSNFYLVADTIIPHHYWAVNQATGAQPLNYVWNWGDGLYDSTAYPSHIYAVAGYYTICLNIQDSNSCSHTMCIPYNIQKMSAENSIIAVDVVDTIPGNINSIENTGILQSWSIFPNPASTDLSVSYSLLTASHVNIEVYDVLGKKLQQVMNEDNDAGEHHVSISAEKLSLGIYFLQIRVNDLVESQKVVLLR